MPVSRIALLHGPDQPGLVARVASWIFAWGGNILHADQHRDMEASVFFQRVEWVSVQAGAAAYRKAEEFLAFARSLGMAARVAQSDRRPRVALLVSKADHCFHDLVLPARAGGPSMHGPVYCCSAAGAVLFSIVAVFGFITLGISR